MPMGGGPPPDFLSHSHGEGFLRFFEERCQKQGIFIFDEPESALSPARQIEFLKLMRRMEEIGHLPGHHGHAFADADGLSQRAAAAADEIRPGAATVKETDHYKVMREFCADPKGFVEAVIDEWTPHRREVTSFDRKCVGWVEPCETSFHRWVRSPNASLHGRISIFA